MDDDGFMMANRRHRHSLYTRAKDLFQAKDVVIKHDYRKADDDEEDTTDVSDPKDHDPRCNCNCPHIRVRIRMAEGVAVARWERPSSPASGLPAEPWPSSGRVHWPALPESVTLQIVAKLPFSAFCSFRSICKEWSALIPDPRVMTVRSTSPPSPVCVMHWSACYNASTHDWQRLPTSFHPQGTRHFVAACGGLLLLRGEGSVLTLWVVNPVNNSEMKLPELPGTFHNQGRTHALALEFKEDESNFQVFHIMECCEEVGQDGRTHSKLEVRIFNSEEKCWRYAGAMLDVRHVKSITEFKHVVYALVSGERDPAFLSIVELSSKERDVYGRRSWWSETIVPTSRRIQDGNLFVRNGTLFVAVVLCSNLPYDNGGPLFRDRKGRMVSVWRFFAYLWRDVVAMPEKFRDKLVVGPSPDLDVCGDFLWISSKEILNKKLEGRTYTTLFVSSRIMCHIPTNTWWELPHFRESPLYQMHYEVYEEKSRLYGHDTKLLDAAWKVSIRLLEEVFDVDSFLFQPRMDLIL